MLVRIAPVELRYPAPCFTLPSTLPLPFLRYLLSSEESRVDDLHCSEQAVFHDYCTRLTSRSWPHLTYQIRLQAQGTVSGFWRNWFLFAPGFSSLFSLSSHTLPLSLALSLCVYCVCVSVCHPTMKSIAPYPFIYLPLIPLLSSPRTLSLSNWLPMNGEAVTNSDLCLQQ